LATQDLEELGTEREERDEAVARGRRLSRELSLLERQKQLIEQEIAAIQAERGPFLHDRRLPVWNRADFAAGRSRHQQTRFARFPCVFSVSSASLLFTYVHEISRFFFAGCLKPQKSKFNVIALVS